MSESIEQFLKACGKYKRVEDIPADEKAAMLERINVDEIDRHRVKSKLYQRVHQAKKKRARPEQQGVA